MKKALYLLVLMAVALASCTNQRTIRVKKTNFDPEAQRGQNLVFTFNHELITDSRSLTNGTQQLIFSSNQK